MSVKVFRVYSLKLSCRLMKRVKQFEWDCSREERLWWKNRKRKIGWVGKYHIMETVGSQFLLYLSAISEDTVLGDKIIQEMLQFSA